LQYLRKERRSLITRRSLKLRGCLAFIGGIFEGLRLDLYEKFGGFFQPQIVGTRVRAVGQPWVEVLNIVNFTRVFRKRAPNLTIQSHMLNRTTNFTRGRNARIHNI